MSSAFTALFVSVAVSLLLGPWIIRVLARFRVGQSISEDAPERHRTKAGTPTMGGIIILLGLFAGVLAARGLSAQASRLLPVLVMLTAFALLGFADDYLSIRRGKNLGLKARQKLAGQFAIAIGFIVWMSLLREDITTLRFLGKEIFDLGWVYYPLAVIFIVGMSNAVNLTDGLDGLVAGLTASVALALGIVAGSDMGLAILGLALSGACLGFLWYNGNPARVFMGDTGSLAIGGGLAGMAIAMKEELVLLIVGALFIIEALSVMVQVISFKSTGRRVFKMTPIHHHFELSGWAEQKIVVRFWIVQVLLVFALLAMVLGRYGS
ncbi:MAG: phospho-N-acetylmuramoyl-pentapeptide-transferase [Armatimonadota bacterium]